MSRALPLPLPPLSEVLGHRKREALDAFARSGWKPWATPIGLDAERRRVLNVDLTEPDVALLRADDPVAVAHVEADKLGVVTHVEVVAVEGVSPDAIAAALLGDPGEPRVGGDAEAREWVWGPESGLEVTVGHEPVRLWIAAERAYGDRLWMIASLVRRS